MAKKANPRDLILQLASAGLTQKQIASRIGKSVRQVRRYKSGEAVPTGNTFARLSKSAANARKEERATVYIEREERGKVTRRKVRQRTRAVPLPRDVVVPRAMRREIRNYVDGKWTPENGYHLSDWINYDVSGWGVGDIVRFVQGVARSAGKDRPYVQLTFLAPAEDVNISGTPYLANARYQRSGSMIRDLGGLDAEGLRRWVNEELAPKGRRALAVAVAPRPANRPAANLRRKKRVWRARKAGASKA